MTPDDMQSLWNSESNQPQQQFLPAAQAAIDHDTRTARRKLAYMLPVVAITFTFAVWQMLKGNMPTGPLSLLAATWLAALLLIRLYRRRETEQPTTIRGTIESLQKRSLDRSRECRVLLGLFAAFVPLLAVAIFQLKGAGRIRPHELISMAMLFGAVLAGGIGWFTYELRWLRLPEQRHLARLLDQYRP